MIIKVPTAREIEAWRTANDLTVAELCLLLGIRTLRSWFHYKNGRKLPVDVAFRFMALREKMQA